MAFTSLKNRIRAFWFGAEGKEVFWRVLGTGVVCLFMLVWTFQTSELPEDGDYMGDFLLI